MERLELADEALPENERDNEWRELVTQDTDGTVNVALVGKYGLEDAYISIHESLKHGGLDSGVDVNVEWIHSEELADGYNGELDDVDGLVVPGGFGARGTEGKIEAIRYARENDLPFLGLCLGFQMAVVEYARNVLGLTGAHSAELDEETDHAVIDILPEQKDLRGHGRDDAPGLPMSPKSSPEPSPTDLWRHVLYGTPPPPLRGEPRLHRRPRRSGPRVLRKSGRRMEILELPDHSYFFGTQFHPEFRSRPGCASPPFVGFVESMLAEDEAVATTDARN